MRQTEGKFCRDVSVICQADCWTDHKLLRAKVALQVGGEGLVDTVLQVTSYMMLSYVLHIMNQLWRELLPCGTRICQL